MPLCSLAVQPLWLKDVRENSEFRVNLAAWVRQPWDEFKNDKEAKAGGFRPWVRWYEARLAGREFGGSRVR
jgi:hypothetical protein